MLMRAGADIAKVDVLCPVPSDTAVFDYVTSVMLKIERSQRRHQFLDLRANDDDAVCINRAARQTDNH